MPDLIKGPLPLWPGRLKFLIHVNRKLTPKFTAVTSDFKRWGFAKMRRLLRRKLKLAERREPNPSRMPGWMYLEIIES